MAQKDLTFTPIVGADGTATITIKPTDGLSTWTILQISAQIPSAPSGATGNVYKNGYMVSPFVPTGDTVAGDPPVILLPSDVLTVKWTGCTPGSTGQVLATMNDGT